MKRDYWQGDKLRKAAQLLTDADRNLHTSFPHSPARPDPTTLPAVVAMLSAAIECIKEAQPS
ncbi:MAG: hypothetical protein WBB98_04980 [Xanthobacteraceae bacterium]